MLLPIIVKSEQFYSISRPVTIDHNIIKLIIERKLVVSEKPFATPDRRRLLYGIEYILQDNAISKYIISL